MSVPPQLAFDICHDVYAAIRADLEGIPLIDPTKVPSDHLWRANRGPNGSEYVADFAICVKRALAGPHNSPRLILATLYYLDLVPYKKALRQMQIREDVWVSWTDDIRNRVGALIIERGMFPPRAYFGERSRPRRAKRASLADRIIPHESGSITELREVFV